MTGTTGSTGYIRLDDSADNYERNRTDHFVRSGPNVGSIRYVTIYFDPLGGAHAEWLPDRVTVEASRSQTRRGSSRGLPPTGRVRVTVGVTCGRSIGPTARRPPRWLTGTLRAHNGARRRLSEHERHRGQHVYPRRSAGAGRGRHRSAGRSHLAGPAGASGIACPIPRLVTAPSASDKRRSSRPGGSSRDVRIRWPRTPRRGLVGHPEVPLAPGVPLATASTARPCRCGRSMSSSHVIRSRRSVLGRRWRNGGSDTHGVNAKAAELLFGAQGGRDGKGHLVSVTAKRRLCTRLRRISSIDGWHTGLDYWALLRSDGVRTGSTRWSDSS